MTRHIVILPSGTILLSRPKRHTRINITQPLTKVSCHTPSTPSIISSLNTSSSSSSSCLGFVSFFFFFFCFPIMFPSAACLKRAVKLKLTPKPHLFPDPRSAGADVGCTLLSLTWTRWRCVMDSVSKQTRSTRTLATYQCQTGLVEQNVKLVSH